MKNADIFRYIGCALLFLIVAVGIIESVITIITGGSLWYIALIVVLCWVGFLDVKMFIGLIKNNKKILN